MSTGSLMCRIDDPLLAEPDLLDESEPPLWRDFFDGLSWVVDAAEEVVAGFSWLRFKIEDEVESTVDDDFDGKRDPRSDEALAGLPWSGSSDR